MDGNKKIKISSSFLLVKILFSVVILYCIKLLYDESQSISEIDFKTSLEIKIVLIFFFSVLLYFFLQPNIFYDEANLYIKKVNKKILVISLKNIRTLFNNPITAKGRSTFSIEYIDDTNKTESIKFNIYYYSDRITNFISYVKKINPKVEIL